MNCGHGLFRFRSNAFDSVCVLTLCLIWSLIVSVFVATYFRAFSCRALIRTFGSMCLCTCG